MLFTKSKKVFLLSFFYYITLYIVLNYSLSEKVILNSNLFKNFFFGDNLKYFLSSDAWKFWLSSSSFIQSIDSFYEFIIFILDPLISFSVKYLFFFKFFTNNTIIIQIPIIALQCLNILLVYRISSKFFNYFDIKSESPPLFLSLIFLVLPFQLIWVFSPIDDVFSNFSLLIFIYFLLNCIDF